MDDTNLRLDEESSPSEAVACFVQALARKAGLARERAYWLRLAVEEITTNIIHHGYQGAGPIWLTGRIGAVSVSVQIEDTARAFDPRTHDPQVELAAAPAEREAGGLGLFLALRKLDGFRYEYADGKNHNTLIMNRPIGTRDG